MAHEDYTGIEDFGSKRVVIIPEGKFNAGRAEIEQVAADHGYVCAGQHKQSKAFVYTNESIK